MATDSGKQQGYVLLISLVLLAAVMTLGLSMLRDSAYGRKIFAGSNKNAESRYAAESAIALLINRTANAVDTNGYLVEVPSTTINIEGYQVTMDMQIETDSHGNTRVDSIRTDYDLLTFRSYADIEATSSKAGGGSTARIRQRVAFDQYPLFQFAIYWEGVMLLDPGSDMNISGRTHCNSRIKLYPPGSNLTFSDWLTSPCEIWTEPATGDLQFMRTDGVLGALHSIPGGNNTPLDTPYCGNSPHRVKVAYGSNVSYFKMPIAGYNPILIIQPKNVDELGQSGFSETETTKKEKLIYNADLIFRKRPSGFTINRSWYRNNSDGTDAAVSSSNNTSYNKALDTPSVSGNHKDSLYDYSDGLWMTVTYVNVAKFFTNDPTATDQIIYLEGKFDSTQTPKVRDVFCLYNAATLNRALTFVSNCPIYIWGSYNSHATKSSAIMSDLITVLSKNWSPSYSASTSTRTGANDTVMACLMGGVRRARVDPSWNDPNNANYYNWNLDENSTYSDRTGQPHNHMSFMENFSGYTMTFSGSLVAMWRCLHLTGEWRFSHPAGNNNVYTQPARNYNFDSRYNNLANMPPGTPVVISPFNLDYYEVHEE